MNRFDELKNLVDSLEDDFNKFYGKGNKAAGTRLRKAMQELKAMAQDIRVDIQEIKSRPATPRMGGSDLPGDPTGDWDDY